MYYITSLYCLSNFITVLLTCVMIHTIVIVYNVLLKNINVRFDYAIVITLHNIKSNHVIYS